MPLRSFPSETPRDIIIHFSFAVAVKVFFPSLYMNFYLKKCFQDCSISSQDLKERRLLRFHGDFLM